LPRLIRGLAELAEVYDILFCDVWGVLHDGLCAYPGAVGALCRFRARGGKVVLITNAPMPSRIVQLQLAKIGVPAEAYDAIVSSGDVTAALICARNEAALFPLGPFEGTDLFEEVCRLRRGSKPRLAPVESADFVLCTVFVDPDEDRLETYDPVLAEILGRRLDMICANPDIVVQQGNKLYFCAGAVAERYAAMGGKVIMAGKPFAPIYSAAFAALEDGGGKVNHDRVLVIGDAMRTDIKGAADQGLASLFVTSGIHRDDLHKGAGSGDLDRAAYHQFIEEAGCPPTASIAALAW
jgi:HAD superfamily hydrolase (TIGR01459 family)